MEQTQIPYSLIKNSARRIGDRLHPQRIVLFGSYAYGKPNADSDVDLLIIFRERKKITERYRKISKILEPRPFPIDILIRSSQEIRDRLKQGDHFIKQIIENGKVLYEI